LVKYKNIEADGDYWHCNPKFFTTPNNTQQLNINNDFFKNKLAKDKGFLLIRFWESNVKQENFNEIFLELINGIRKSKL
jgi:hypothetical protein